MAAHLHGKQGRLGMRLMTNGRMGVWDLRGNKVGRYRGVEIEGQQCRFCGLAKETELHIIIFCPHQNVSQLRDRMWKEIEEKCGEEKVARMKSASGIARMSELLGGNKVEQLKGKKQTEGKENSRAKQNREESRRQDEAIREAVQVFLISIEKGVKLRGDRSLLTDIFDVQEDEAEWEESAVEAWGRPEDIVDGMQHIQAEEKDNE